MLHWIVWLLALLCPDEDAEALRRTAPAYLTSDTAAYHVTAARVAALAYQVDPDLILSTAYFESRYTNARTKEPKGKTSCGVMTPVPKKVCKSPPSLAAGYLEGAAHLREWMDACERIRRPGFRCTILGYAGGGLLIRACDKGPVMGDRGGKRVNLCSVVRWRLDRAARIRRLRFPLPERRGV